MKVRYKKILDVWKVPFGGILSHNENVPLWVFSACRTGKIAFDNYYVGWYLYHFTGQQECLYPGNTWLIWDGETISTCSDNAFRLLYEEVKE